MFNVMPPNVFSAYQRYFKLNERSLAKLAEENDSPSLSTLKRWSIRYGWLTLAKVHDEALTQRMLHDLVERRTLTTLELIAEGKKNFLNWARVDGDVRELSARERRHLSQPTVRDFIRLIRFEQELLSTRPK